MGYAKCQECGQTMNSASCTWKYIKINGQLYKRNTSYFDHNARCHDCGIINKRGNIHHFGCDMERCPRCHGQLIGCNCTGKTPHKNAQLTQRSATQKTKVAKNPYAIGIGGW